MHAAAAHYQRNTLAGIRHESLHIHLVHTLSIEVGAWLQGGGIMHAAEADQ